MPGWVPMTWPSRSTISPGSTAFGRKPADHVGVAPTRHEANVPTVVLVGHFARNDAPVRGLGLGHVAKRKAAGSRIARSQTGAVWSRSLSAGATSAGTQPSARRGRRHSARSPIRCRSRGASPQIANCGSSGYIRCRAPAFLARGDNSVKIPRSPTGENGLVIEHMQCGCRSARQHCRPNVLPSAARPLAMGRRAMVVKPQRNAGRRRSLATSTAPPSPRNSTPDMATDTRCPGPFQYHNAAHGFGQGSPRQRGPGPEIVSAAFLCAHRPLKGGPVPYHG